MRREERIIGLLDCSIESYDMFDPYSYVFFNLLLESHSSGSIESPFPFQELEESSWKN